MPQAPTPNPRPQPQQDMGLSNLLQDISPLLGGFLPGAAGGNPLMAALGMVPGQLFGQGPFSIAGGGTPGGIGSLMQPAAQQAEAPGMPPQQAAPQGLGPLAGILPMLTGGGLAGILGRGR